MALLCRTRIDVCRSCSQRFVLAHAGTPELKVLAFKRMSHKAMCLKLVRLHSAVCCRPYATPGRRAKKALLGQGSRLRLLLAQKKTPYKGCRLLLL
jgi:hypothetical protein